MVNLNLCFEGCSFWDCSLLLLYFILIQFSSIWDRSFGPTNGFEEMIELTKQGKMWPYPIDNEYQIDEADVSTVL